jgi:hypothetical protein
MSAGVSIPFFQGVKGWAVAYQISDQKLVAFSEKSVKEMGKGK